MLYQLSYSPTAVEKEGTRTLNIHFTLLNFYNRVAASAFISYIIIIQKNFIKVKCGDQLLRSVTQIHYFILLLDNVPIVSSISWFISIILRKSA